MPNKPPKKQRQAWAAEGKQAHDRGQQVTACPYGPLTVEHDWWLHGWWKSYYENERLNKEADSYLRQVLGDDTVDRFCW